jgi:hypothetical protein
VGLLDFFGLGQSDIKEVFVATIRNVSAMKDQSPAKRDGAAFAIATMIEELLNRDVATKETYDELMNSLKLWHKKNVVP